MDKKAISKILFATGSLVLIAGAGTYFYQQYLLTDYLCYGIKGFRIKKAGLDSTTVELMLSIENKADLDIELKKMTMDVYANDVYVAKINQEVSRSIKPLSTTELPVTISFNPKKVLGSVLNIVTATSLKDIKFRFDGKVVVKKFGIPIPIPFDFGYTISQMMAPSGASVCEDKKA